LTVTVLQGVTTEEAVQRVLAALEATPNMTITTPFVEVPDGDPGTYAGTIRSFSLCTVGADAEGLCFNDRGLNARAHREVFDAVNASAQGEAKLGIVYGCGVVHAPAFLLPASASTGANVAGVMVAVFLVIITTIWIKHASVKNMQAAQSPSRILCVSVSDSDPLLTFLFRARVLASPACSPPATSIAHLGCGLSLTT
jgi:hypothetical protein